MNQTTLKHNLELAITLFQQGKLPQAKQTLLALVNQNAEIALSWFLLGAIYAQENNPRSAIESLTKATLLQPEYPDAYNNLGVMYEAINNPQMAKECYLQAIEQKPRYAQALKNIGNLVKAEGQLEQALDYYHQSIESDPTYVDALNNLGLAYTEKRQLKEAEKYLKQALAKQANDPMVLNNLGQVYAYQYRYNDALNLFQKALTLAPGLSSVFLNLGLLMAANGDYNAARQYYLQAAKDPNMSHSANNNISQIELLNENFVDGWDYYRYRSSTRNQLDKLLDTLMDDLTGSNCLIVKDQGLGDEIFFARFLPYLQARGTEITYYTDERLAPMLGRSLSNIKITCRSENQSQFDFTLPVSELPRLLWSKINGNFPTSIELCVDDKAIQSVRYTIPNNRKKNIAISWEAGTPGSTTLYKRIDPYELGQMLRHIPANILIIQRNPKSKDIKALENGLRRKAFNLSFLNDNLEEMLAFVSIVDEYVAVSNTNIHLMAGVNKKVRILVPHPPEWRWTLNQRSPWFPNFDLYRQDSSGSWQKALQKCFDDLSDTISH